MSKTDEEILITAELPGVDKDNLEISFSENKITIRGENKEIAVNHPCSYHPLSRSVSGQNHILRGLQEPGF